MDVTEANFEEIVLQSDVPVMVDLWAEWCGPCRLVGPIIDEIGEDMEGKVKVVKLFPREFLCLNCSPYLTDSDNTEKP